MADYIVKDTELTSVANAIRTAGGTNSLLSFPNGFVSAVGNISGGGGGSSDFSTAEVTVQITSAQPGVAIYIPTVISSSMETIFNNPYNPTNSSTPQTVTVPLYKGSLIIIGIWDSGDVTVDISGSVQVMENSFLITGDCTITIS